MARRTKISIHSRCERRRDREERKTGLSKERERREEEEKNRSSKRHQMTISAPHLEHTRTNSACSAPPARDLNPFLLRSRFAIIITQERDTETGVGTSAKRCSRKRARYDDASGV